MVSWFDGHVVKAKKNHDLGDFNYQYDKGTIKLELNFWVLNL